MITLAFDTATDRCTVAATDGERVTHAHLDGSRRHAAAILGMIDGVLAELDAGPPEIGRVITGDGPGSFTGLRVAAAVAKALTWQRAIEWQVASSLLVRAAAHAPAGGGVVLALSDALRGELYAGYWRIDGTDVVQLGMAPRALRPDALVPGVDVVVGTIPSALVAAVTQATGCEPIIGETALPDARTLLALALLRGGTTIVADPASWQPEYGRPAETQAVWERNHGRNLPAASSVTR
jgi:tRNA threonylcarbamoyladenosine biosynthesis protein TsaB